MASHKCQWTLQLSTIFEKAIADWENIFVDDDEFQQLLWTDHFDILTSWGQYFAIYAFGIYLEIIFIVLQFGTSKTSAPGHNWPPLLTLHYATAGILLKYIRPRQKSIFRTYTKVFIALKNLNCVKKMLMTIFWQFSDTRDSDVFFMEMTLNLEL